MNWTEITVSVAGEHTDTAAAIANMTVPYGIYIEDYSDLEENAWEIAHIDLIDEELIAKCREEITDEDFYETLVAVNQYLASSKGKKAKELLKNPPPYKPKKEKKGLMASMMSAGMQQQ